jgi:hypothetical protein
MSEIMDSNIIVASKMIPLDLVIAVHRDSQAVLSYIVGLEEENNRLRTNHAGNLRHQLQTITQDGFNSMILEIDKVINSTNSTFVCMQDQIRHALQTRSVGNYITPRPNVLIHYPEPKKDEEKGSLMARRGKDMLSISDLQHAFSTHDPLGRDSKVVQEGSAFQSFLDSARSIGIKCSPPQETALKSTSAPQQTTPTKTAGIMSSQSNSNIKKPGFTDEKDTSGKYCDNNILDIEKTDPATNGKCSNNEGLNIEEESSVAEEKTTNGKCANTVSNNETIEEGATTLLAPSSTPLISPTKNVVEAAIVPNLKYTMNQLLHLRKTACTNPFEQNTDEEIKLILPNGLEHRGRLPYVARLPKRWGLNVGSTVSNIQVKPLALASNVDPEILDNQVRSWSDVKPNVDLTVSNIENSGSSPLMTFSDTEESPKPINLEKNVETTRSNIHQSNAPLSKVAHNDEAASFLAWMMGRDTMKLGGK